jgi:hypothetical protein
VLARCGSGRATRVGREPLTHVDAGHLDVGCESENAATSKAVITLVRTIMIPIRDAPTIAYWRGADPSF